MSEQEQLDKMSDHQRHRILTAVKIRRATQYMAAGTIGVSLGSMFLKKHNGLSLAEDLLQKFSGDAPANYAEEYWNSVTKKGTTFDHIPAPEQIDAAKRWGNQFLGAGCSLMVLFPAAQLTGWAAEKLYLHVINPEQKQR